MPNVLFSVFLLADIMKVIVTALLHSSATRWRSRCFITQQTPRPPVYNIYSVFVSTVIDWWRSSWQVDHSRFCAMIILLTRS